MSRDPDRWGRLRTPLLVAVAAALLASAVSLGVAVDGQTRKLERTLAVTDAVVNANVRTIGQVQRELLRLQALLELGETDPAEIELHRGFVAQRLREATGRYQATAVGSTPVQEENRRLSRIWAEEIDPLVRSVAADPSGTPDERAAAVAAIAELEPQYLVLTTRSEADRRARAGEVQDAAATLLGGTRRLLVGLVVTLGAFGGVAGLALWSVRRSNRRRAAAQLELVAAAERLRLLSEVASRTDNLVVITDAAGATQWVNDSFVTHTGWTLEEVLGRSPGEVLQCEGTDPAAVAHMRERVAAGAAFSCEVLNQTRDGTPYWVAIDAQPVLDADGVLTHFVAVETDVTERRRSEQQLRDLSEAATRSARAKADFLASMSHEIRTPLNAVIGLNDLLLDTELSHQQREFVATARDSGRLLLDLVNDILSFSALDAGEVTLDRERFDLAGLVGDTCRMFRELARDSGLELRHDIDPRLGGDRLGDPVRIRQVLVNLIGNAIKFTERGEVVVRAEPTGGGDGVRLSVADTGVGIPAELLPTLFDPFSQADSSSARRFGGTGLGLAICDRIVTLMGGRIEVTSSPGIGTVVAVLVELAPAPAPAGPVPPDGGDEPVAWDRLRVLVAEDDPVNRLVAHHLLERIGVPHHIVADGTEARRTVAAEHFDVVLMDIHMPGVDGIEAARGIRADAEAGAGTAAPPLLVAMTASALTGDRERFLAEGLDDYVSKPVRLEDLVEVLGRAARERVAVGGD